MGQDSLDIQYIKLHVKGDIYYVKFRQDPDPRCFLGSDPDPFFFEGRIRINFFSKFGSGSKFFFRKSDPLFLKSRIWIRVKSGCVYLLLNNVVQGVIFFLTINRILII